jgi:hypothetical protein
MLFFMVLPREIWLPVSKAHEAFAGHVLSGFIKQKSEFSAFLGSDEDAHPQPEVIDAAKSETIFEQNACG